MRAFGMVRKIDEQGRISLPKEIRDIRGIGIGTPVEIYVEDEKIILTKYNPKYGALAELDALDETILRNSREFGELKTAELREHLDSMRQVLKRWESR